ncbi:hypothetical protein [Mucilaginibacter psychrotolerans]|uniref:Uncharacterized protein n=1 Tax=Mucilaginibacter psychrotolerans TaxID=1524096 RepID=A0A4Y8S555_9SPHI|nr:hypothetical protein [Mucilaginibacter psychrotolerans]TFF34099.1 hypothetical protein E2R66_22985 [Mucilaginibacter psychrotolerans]
MKSEFKFWAYLLMILSMVFTVLTVMVVSGNALNPTIPLVAFLVACLFFLFTWTWFFFGELRTKVIAVEIKSDEITVKRYLGLSFKKTFPIDAFDGYKTSILSSKSGSYEYLYLIADGKRVIKLSEFYHKNYKDLKRIIINKRFKNLRFESFSYLNELRDIFI